MYKVTGFSQGVESLNYKKITLLQIEYFLAVSKYLNFTEAAKKIYVSQPSLSKQIAMIEQEIGVPLFLRTRRNVHLTPAGTVLFKELRGITVLIESSIEKARQPELGENSTITIGFLEAMDTGVFLTPMIKNFKKQHPGVEFKNRIQTAPMVPCMATPEGWVTKEVIEFYRPFAKGGAAIVTVGDSAVNWSHAMNHEGQLNLGDDNVKMGLDDLADEIQRYGAVISVWRLQADRKCIFSGSYRL
jgi:hypothetical protein